MSDTITTLGSSLIQHGSDNDRIYLMKLAAADFPGIIAKLDELAAAGGYSKIFAKIPEYALEGFLERGYRTEAKIPYFYNGQDTACFMGKYFSEKRQQPENWDEIINVLSTAKSKACKTSTINPSGDYTYYICEEGDIQAITGLYKKVFATYPFPIHDPDYIASTMKSNVTYFGVRHQQDLIALSSAEMDPQASNVEMTDFAAHPDYRGQGLAALLLPMMEDYVRKIGFKTAYTIARSLSYGMNITFAKLGYTYSGTLINNTNISGSLESMNVWYKSI